MSDEHKTPAESPTAKRLRLLESRGASFARMGSLFPNWTGWKTTKIVLTAIALAAGSLAKSPDLPATVDAIAATVAQCAGALTLVVIALSGTSGGPPVAKTPEAKAAVARSIAPPPVGK